MIFLHTCVNRSELTVYVKRDAKKQKYFISYFLWNLSEYMLVIINLEKVNDISIYDFNKLSYWIITQPFYDLFIVSIDNLQTCKSKYYKVVK